MTTDSPRGEIATRVEASKRGSMDSIPEDLETLRLEIDRRLAIIEELALRRKESAEKTRELERKLAEVERSRRSREEQFKRWEAERRAILDELEHDRTLLAEAWNRLEQEETRRSARTDRSDRRDVHRVERNDSNAPKVAVHAAAPAPAPAEEDHVAQSILRQFRSLQRDVRRNAGEA